MVATHFWRIEFKRHKLSKKTSSKQRKKKWKHYDTVSGRGYAFNIAKNAFLARLDEQTQQGDAPIYQLRITYLGRKRQ